MRVRMKTLGAGPAGVWRPGDVIEVDAEQAAELIGGGYADSCEEPTSKPVFETMTAPADGERAALRARARRARKEKQ